MHEHLTEFISKQLLLRCEKSDKGTYLEAHVLYILMQVKFLCKLILRALQQFVAFGMSEFLHEAPQIANWFKFLVLTEVFDEILE